MNKDELIKTGLSELQKLFFNFLTKKYKENVLKNVRVKSNKTLTFICLCRCKTYSYDFLKSSNENNKNILFIDFDSKDNYLLNSNFELNAMIRNNNDNNDVLLLPLLYKIILQLKNDFFEKSIVIITSNLDLCEYTSLRLPCEILTFVPSLKYYNELDSNLIDEKSKNQLFNSYNKLLLSKRNLRLVSSLENLREQLDTLFN